MPVAISQVQTTVLSVSQATFARAETHHRLHAALGAAPPTNAPRNARSVLLVRTRMQLVPLNAWRALPGPIALRAPLSHASALRALILTS